jgi:eukaryotic-like serine/threonine-protein kinase
LGELAVNERDLFIAALQIDDPIERADYLDEACGGNNDLRKRIDVLLIVHRASSSLEDMHRDDRSEAAAAPDDDSTIAGGHSALVEGPGTIIGPYKLLQKIGEGGMGAVFMAEQEKPVRRKVALKVIKAGMDTGQVVARFEAERQALAIMDHPHIARVLDAGATDTGRPFFVMELVKGIPITEYCDRNHLTPKERLELFIPVCQAIQHAHQKGIIHRDIKPSNVLVTIHDGRPVPKVIDFGVAKAIDQRLTERTMFTEFGQVIGTLEYMSPEQAEMGALDIDTRSDIYSLGVMLYELLTGSTPLERAKLRNAAYAEILKRIREEEPPKPSTRLSESKDSLPSISAQRKMEPARLTRLVRGELDWIVLKSLEKDRTRRYETANGFARDIQRYLDGDTVEACPPSATYKLKKFARKHRAALATVGAFALLLIAATGVSVGLALWANRERRRAEDREQLAIGAVRRFADVVRETPELKDTPSLATLRAKLLKEPLLFFKSLRDRLQADRTTTPASFARLAAASFELGQLSDEIGDKQDALRAFEESLAIRGLLARENPAVIEFQSDLARSHLNIGILQRDTGRTAEALASYERALAIFERLSRRDPSVRELQRALAASNLNIGNLQRDTGRPSEALASYEQARAISERLVRENPSVTEFRHQLAMTHNSIGVLQSETGRPVEALASQEKARAIKERLALENPSVTLFQSELAQSHFNTGELQYFTGRPAEALAAYERALAIFERLALENPSVASFRKGLARSHSAIGMLRALSDRPGEALVSLEEARAHFERLARANPSVTEFQSGLAAGHMNIGFLQMQLRRLAEALNSVEQARQIYERLARENPSVTEFQSALAECFGKIGNLQRFMARPVEAYQSHERARAIQQRLVREHPESPNFVSAFGGTLNNMAQIDLDRRRFDEALAKLTQAIKWQRRALAANPNHPTYRQFMANHLINLIKADEGLGHADEADQARRDLVELAASDPAKAALNARLATVIKGQETPKDDIERTQLAYCAYEKGLHASSARLYAEALANSPKLAQDRKTQHAYNAACAAALAGSGQSKDDPKPDEAARAKLRRQALDWLKGELSNWATVQADGPADMKAMVPQTLKHWKTDSDLAGIRDEKELAKLPDDERAALKEVWKDVDQLLTKALGSK